MTQFLLFALYLVVISTKHSHTFIYILRLNHFESPAFFGRTRQPGNESHHGGFQMSGLDAAEFKHSPAM